MGLLENLIRGGLDVGSRVPYASDAASMLGRVGAAQVPSGILAAAGSAAPIAAGAGVGAAGSLAGTAFGLLDKPRQALWSMIPGLHDEDGNAKDTAAAGNDLLSALGIQDQGEDSAGGTLAGLGLSVATDPLTFLGGLGGAAGKGIKAGEEAYQTAKGISSGTKAIQAEQEALGGLKGVAAAAAEKAPRPGVVGIGGSDYLADDIKQALAEGRPGVLKEIGSTYNRYDPDMADALVQRGYAHKLPQMGSRDVSPLFVAKEAGTATRGGTPQFAQDFVGPNGPLNQVFNPQPPVTLRQTVVNKAIQDGVDPSEALANLYAKFQVLDSGTRGELMASPIHQSPELIQQLMDQFGGQLGDLDAQRGKAGLLTRLFLNRMGG